MVSMIVVVFQPRLRVPVGSPSEEVVRILRIMSVISSEMVLK